MKLSSCLDILKKIEKQEWEAMSHIVNCKYFNKDKSVTKLFFELEKMELNEKEFDVEFQYNIYKKVFPHMPEPSGRLTKNQNSQLNRKFNDLKRIVERFLMVEALEKNQVCRDMLLYPELQKRDQPSILNKHFNQEEKLLRQTTIKGEDYYAQCYQLEHAKLQYYNAGEFLLAKDNLDEVNQNLDLYYILRKLSLHLTALSLLRVSSRKTYDFSSVDAAYPLIQLPQHANQPLIMAYEACVELVKTPSDKAYWYMVKVLEQFDDIIPSEVLITFYTALVSYCIHQINTGNITYEQSLFQTYKRMHENGLLIEDSLIQIRVLKNVVASGCRVGEFEWAATIIEIYRGNIQKSIRQNVCNFNYGSVAFYKKDYEVAYDTFYGIGKIDTFHDINIRVLLLKCLYEKDEKYDEYTEPKFRTSERFFRDNESLNPKRKKAYKNFIQILIHLYRIRHGVTKMTLERLVEKLEEKDIISDKKWLLEKISELE